MSSNIGRFGLGLLSALFAFSAATTTGYAAAKPVKGSGSATYATANFTYDGNAAAVQLSGSGKDNFGGKYTVSSVAEWALNGAACATTSGASGVEYDLVGADGVSNYTKGQVYYTSTGAAASTQCVTATGAFSGTVNFIVGGGSGSYATASGTVSVAFTGQTTSAPNGGLNGLFGAETFTQSGSITK